MEPTDEQLMRHVTAGETAALGVLFDRYEPRLTAFLTRFLGERAVAEDVAQDTFWKVWENRAVYDSRRQSFRVFLYVVARNLARNEHNRAGRRRTVPLDHEVGGESSEGPAHVSERRYVQDCVRTALLTLPEEQRLCVVLREYEGYSFRETAQVLGVSEVHARVLAFRARARLKHLLVHLLESEPCHVEPQP